DYVRLYRYADVDSLLELFGHIRAVNPLIETRFKTTDAIAEDDYTSHLVLLGGVDWNPVTRDIHRRLSLPVRQESRPDDEPYNGYFQVTDGDGQPTFAPMLDSSTSPPILQEDVAFFYRGVNPYNARRTITMCN